MPRTHTTSLEYQSFYKRIEEKFNIEELTRENILRWMRNDSRMIDNIALARDLILKIKGSNTIEELRDIREETSDLLVYKKDVSNRINERSEEIRIRQRELEIARGFVGRVAVFAQKKKVAISERVIGREEKWRNKKMVIITIRDRFGRFITHE